MQASDAGPFRSVRCVPAKPAGCYSSCADDGARKGGRDAAERPQENRDPLHIIANEEPPVDTSEGETPGSTMPRGELSRRVARSIVASSVLGFASLIIGFFGNLVLARLLSPREFGIVAIGATLVLIAGAIGDAGLGAGMVRWPQEPTRSELSDLTGVQLAITGAIAIVVGAVAVQFGEGGTVVAVMMVAIPLSALQTPGRVLFMRNVRYERLSVIDGTATIGFYLWAIATVAAGLGIWGLATAAIARAVVATALIWIMGEHRIVYPTWHDPWRLRPLAGFGIRFQASYLVFVLREIAVNLLTASIAGVEALGLWSLARRLIEVPYVMVSSLGRVVFPAMAHIIAGGSDPAPVVERSVRVVTVASAISMATFAGLVPALIPGVFGEKWAEVGEIIPWATAAVLVLAGAGVVTVGYLMAADRTQDALRAVSVGTVVWIVVTAALLPAVGVEAAGIGMLAGLCAESALYARATRRNSGAQVVRNVSIALLVGVVGTAVGGVLSVTLEPSLATAVLAGAAGLATTIAGLTVFCRHALVEAIVTIRASARKAVTRSAS